MKKALSIILALALCVCMLVVPAAAESEANVYVTISSAGELAAAQEPISVTDIDSDGALTINDALYCAHEALYDGGAEAGYGSEYGDYGLSMTKLWGVENDGSYGYYVNNSAAWSLLDPVKNGDYISAFSYADLTTWSDKYTYFDVNSGETSVSGDISLTLYGLGYDESWNLVAAPVVGASVTANGSEYTTDSLGRVKLSFDKAGTYTVTASSSSETLVPPVCTVKVRTYDDTVGIWSADDIESVTEMGLFSGTGNGFSPKDDMSRAMMVTVLWRLDGETAPASAPSFNDVKAESYYEDAVAWASENGIVEGYGNGYFGSDDSITRQQLATILFRYAEYKGYDTSDSADIGSFADADLVAAWAVSAMKWANAEKLINGVGDNTLAPDGVASRQQAAAMMNRFVSAAK